MLLHRDGGAGSDSLYGDSYGLGHSGYHLGARTGQDTLKGGDGADRIEGDGPPNVNLGLGVDRPDTLEGGLGDDTLIGEGGNDTYVFFTGVDPTESMGTDTIQEDNSTDTGDILDFSLLSVSGTTGVAVSIGVTTQQIVVASRLSLVLNSASGIEVIKGSAHRDTLTGNSRDNSLFGNAGDDSILGGDGHDTLWGDGGSDTLKGDEGNDLFHALDDLDDYLYGGSGTDTASDRDHLLDALPDSDIEVLT